MSRYTHASPMDFEFQNGTGPVDACSPFIQVSANQQCFPVGGGMSSPLKKRPYGAVDSPSKSRAMGSQQSSPRKPPAAFSGFFTTPQKPKPDYDDSSAGETPRSPEPKDDSDATPDMVSARRSPSKNDHRGAPTMGGAERERGSPVKERPMPDRSDSATAKFLTKVKNKIYSPGRGEIHKPEHVGAIEKRSRRRKKDVDRSVARKRRHSMSDSGDDNDSQRKASGQGDDGKPHWVKSWAAFIVQHPTLPYNLSQWAQLGFNVFLILCCGYLVWGVWAAVQGDIDKRAHEVMADIMVDMAACATQYTNNNCDPKLRVPALETVCNTWAKCMTQDPKKVGRAKVSASVFSEIYNSFVEPISWKAMVFTFVLIFGCFAISNMAFSIVRSKTHEYQQYNVPQGPQVMPTPQRTFSGQDGGFYGGTPWQHPPGWEPQPSGGFGQIDGQGSPVRRLMY